MKELKPTTVAVFITLTCFATVLLLVAKIEHGKIVSAILIFSGVYLVTAQTKSFETKSKGG
jgi:alpha-D-ribose 1-methylphosphonate 5-triphosphate synthase subunit PhnH